MDSKKQLPSGWTRESLREAIIQRSKEIGRPTDELFRGLRALNRMSDERLAEIMEDIENELDMGMGR